VSPFFLRCPRCDFMCAQTAHYCTVCGSSLSTELPDPREAYMSMTNKKRLEAIQRMWQVAQKHGQTHTLSEAMTFFDDRLTGGAV
jgi:hypothetical protein